MYRLHVDIPLGNDKENALAAASQIIEWYFKDIDAKEKIQRLVTNHVEIDQINCRLGHDDDRQKSNYLDINENGHASNKKIRINLSVENA